jgi:hypothetical protein
MRLKLRNVVQVLFACFLFSGLANAQGVGASGDIIGTVTDPSNAVVPNATITVTEAEKGIKRSNVTDSGGVFHFLNLQPGAYGVNVAKSGFQTELANGVVVTIGQTTVVDFHLKVSAATETVEVTAAPPVVELERGHQANVIDQTLIQDLPINRRDYLSFTLLAPGVSESTQMASDTDFRVKQTPQSGLSLYGSNGRGNSVTVDGGEANDDSGGVRPNLSQEAVQEFQINRSNYGADLGGASGASINIVSKSGSNDVHGSTYFFYRNDAMDARNPFAVTQALQPGQPFNPAAPDATGVKTKDSLNRGQFGVTIGGPIKKDSRYLYGAFEGLVQNAQNAVPMLTSTTVFRPDTGQFSGNNQQAIIKGLAALGATPVPCLTGQPALPANACAGILTNILTLNSVNPLSNYLINQLESNGGLFKYNTRRYLASVRYDHQFNSSNRGYLRYYYAYDNEQNPDVQSLVGFSAGSLIHTFAHTIQGAWFHDFSAKTFNELKIQWNYTDFDVVPNAPAQAGLNIPGFAQLGTNIFLPSFTIMRRPEVADNISMVRGHHTMKFGGYFLYRGNHTESHTFFPGRFVFGNLPGGVLSPCLQVPAACGLTPAPLANCQLTNGVFPTPAVGSFCFPAAINGLQSAALGLPQFYQQGFGNPIYNYPRPWTAFYWQDSWALKSNFTFNYGLRYELDSQYGQLSTYKKNFAPRVSFVWDPFKDHRTAVRAGFGLFYSPIYGQIADVVQTLGFVNGIRPIAQVFVPLTGVPGGPPTLTSAKIFQTLFAQGLVQCATPAPGSAACITPANLTQFGINVTNVGPPPPLSVVFSGQPNYRNPYSEQGSFSIEREVAKGLTISGSYIYVHTLHMPVAIDINALPTTPMTVATSPFTGQQVQFRNWRAPQCGANPFLCFGNPLLLQTPQYSSVGSATYNGGIFEIQKRFGNYVMLMGNYTYSKAFDNVTDFNSDFGPQDNTNLASERALSTFDQRHKVVAAAVLNSPWKGRFLSGLQVSPILNYNSGHPFNILAGGTDINGDRHSTNDRPLGFARNSGLGPDYTAVDLRLTEGIKIGERSQLQFTAEAFNVGNRTNFASVNNQVPTLNGFTAVPFNLKGRAFDPTQFSPGGIPGSFTSAFARRQIQLGARVVF